jgi:hypothetical protein
MWLLVALTGCGWLEHRQACRTAGEAEEAAWAALGGTVAPAAELARMQAEATAAAAGAVASAVETVAASPSERPLLSRGEAAQDAFTRASRLGGTAGGASEARWVDWTARAYEQGKEAEHRAELAIRAQEYLALRGRSREHAALAQALASARYEQAVRVGAARAAFVLDPLAPRSVPPANDASRGAVELAQLEAMTDLSAREAAGLEEALLQASSAAYDADRAGQAAKATGAGYVFQGFPASAQTAEAASLAALSAATRAGERASHLRTEVSRWQVAKSAVPAVDAPVEAAIASARAAAQARKLACE